MSDMRYSSRQEAIDNEIIDALGGYEGDYDLDAIFDELFEWGEDQKCHLAHPEKFWDAVEAADRTAGAAR